MEQNENKRLFTYVMSEEAARKVGYLLAQDKDGNVFTYTCCQEGDLKIDQFESYQWKDKKVVATYYSEDVIAIKRFDRVEGIEKMVKFPNGDNNFQFNNSSENQQYVKRDMSEIINLYRNMANKDKSTSPEFINLTKRKF